jgi:L-threonylcarbamoyladenylate synthase
MTINQAAKLIQQGEVVAFPTETVYGLGADANNPEAISRIYVLKGRPADNPLIVHLSDKDQAAAFAKTISSDAKKLMNHCWPGPLTLIFDKKPEVLDAVTSGLSTVALRIPDHPIALELIRKTGPLVAPSANKSGKPSPTNVNHVRQDFGDDFPVLDGGPTQIGLESTVLDLTSTPYTILRPGKYSANDLYQIIGSDIRFEQEHTIQPKSPGVKYSHYKPKAEVRWYTDQFRESNQSSLLLTHKQEISGFKYYVHFNRDYNRMARELYDQFRKADAHNLTHIFIEPFPDEEIDPIIRALKNRIDKAVSH